MEAADYPVVSSVAAVMAEETEMDSKVEVRTAAAWAAEVMAVENMEEEA